MVEGLALPEMPYAAPIRMKDAQDIDDLFQQINEMSNKSTACRVHIVNALYYELERQLKAFYHCRELSLALTNLQQSRLWRMEASRLWAEAGEPKLT